MSYNPFPAGNDPIRRAELVQAAVYAVANKPGDYVSDEIPILKTVGVVPNQGRVLVANPETMFAHGEARDLMARAESAQIGRGPTHRAVEYRAERYGRTTVITDSDWRDYDARGLNALDNLVTPDVETLRILRELRLAGIVGTAANWSTSTAIALPANRWVANTSDPNRDIQTAIDAVDNLGGTADTVICSVDSYRALRNNAPFLQFSSVTTDRSNAPVYAGKDAVADFLAARFGIKRVLIMGARRNGSKVPGTPAIARVAGNWFWVGQLPDVVSPVGMRLPIGSIGPSGQGPSSASALYRVMPEDWSTEETRDGTKKSSLWTNSYVEAMGVLMPELGHLITGTVA